MALSECIGFVAACLTTAAFVPQAVMVLRTRKTGDISLVMYVMFTSGVAAWLVYGLTLGSVPIIIANVITLALASCILCVKIIDVRQARIQGASAARSAPIA